MRPYDIQRKLIKYRVRSLSTRKRRAKYLRNLFTRVLFIGFCKKCGYFDHRKSRMFGTLCWYSCECECTNPLYESVDIGLMSLKDYAIIACLENMCVIERHALLDGLLKKFDILPTCYVCCTFVQYGFYDSRLASTGYIGDTCACSSESYKCRSCCRNYTDSVYCHGCSNAICFDCCDRVIVLHTEGCECPGVADHCKYYCIACGLPYDPTLYNRSTLSNML